MTIRWSPEAVADLNSIVGYIFSENPPVAERIAHAIYDRIPGLESFPNRGRIGRVEGTRELVLSPLPFIVVYRVRGEYVEIARVLHGSQRWP